MSKGFLPNEARRTLFQGKFFIFISKKQVGKNVLSEKINAETPIRQQSCFLLQSSILYLPYCPQQIYTYFLLFLLVTFRIHC